MNDKITFNEVMKKFGDNPKCYLTGLPIDIKDTRSYHFDHIIPTSRGGTNTLDNLGICTKAANMAKSDMTPDELYDLCKLIISHQETK